MSCRAIARAIEIIATVPDPTKIQTWLLFAYSEVTDRYRYLLGHEDFQAIPYYRSESLR